MNSENRVFEHLLESKDNRAEGFDMENKTFEIGVYKDETYGFLIASAYRNGKVIKDHDGLILSKDTILDWLSSSKAQIKQDRVGEI